MTKYYVVGVLNHFLIEPDENTLGITHLTVNTGGMTGYLPVYTAREVAEQNHPNRTITIFEDDQEETNGNN